MDCVEGGVSFAVMAAMDEVAFTADTAPVEVTISDTAMATPITSTVTSAVSFCS